MRIVGLILLTLFLTSTFANPVLLLPAGKSVELKQHDAPSVVSRTTVEKNASRIPRYVGTGLTSRSVNTLSTRGHNRTEVNVTMVLPPSFPDYSSDGFSLEVVSSVYSNMLQYASDYLEVYLFFTIPVSYIGVLHWSAKGNMYSEKYNTLEYGITKTGDTLFNSSHVINGKIYVKVRFKVVFDQRTVNGLYYNYYYYR